MKRSLSTAALALLTALSAFTVLLGPSVARAGGVLGPPVNPDIVVKIERPTGHIGGNSAIQGFAFSSTGIDYLEWVLDGENMGRIPHGGKRGDVPPVYPSYPQQETQNSGFSATWLMALLQPGQHEIIVNAYDKNGGVNSDSVTFTSYRFGDGADRFIRQDEMELQSFVLEGVKLYPGENPHKLFNVEFSWSQGAQSWIISGIEVVCDVNVHGICITPFVAQVQSVTLQEQSFPFFIDVSWPALASSIVGYEIQRRQIFGQIVTAWETIGHSANYSNFFADYGVGILGNDVYEYRVRGFNAAGYGKWSPPSQIPAGNGPILQP